MSNCYFTKTSERKLIAMQKAGNRGKIAMEWFEAGNKLTPETKMEFDKLMKQADKDFKTGRREK